MAKRKRRPPHGNASRKLARVKTKVRPPAKTARAKKIIVDLANRRVSARFADIVASGFNKAIPRYFAGPVFGVSHPYSGGTSMWVQIGAGQGKIGNYGSVPAANTPGVMRDLLDGHYNGFGWIAGHLLNDNLGGLGVAQNLTPLTTAGNKNHLNGCETAIKNYIDKAFARTWQYKAEEYWYGVEYRVDVGPYRWVGADEDDDDDRDPMKYVATELRVWVKAIRMRKSDDSVSDVPPGNAMFFDPLVNVAIDNTGYDLI